jgi:cysteinyl-tRNA synthetase
MTIRLYNTLAREKQAFEPLDPERVTMYVCGPTVYNYAHIGNARPAVIFDLLRRVLEHHFPNVVYARNITDVDDKINKAAADKGVPIEVISKRYTKAYQEDMAALGVMPPSIEPRATEHIAKIIEMIQKLLDSGHAYEADGHVLFSIESYAGYGELSRRDMREMVAGARIEVATFKQHPGDFVLWKPSNETQPGWDSPWGWGRPGWHIECSAMSEAHLGPSIDIHGGGQDLVFPHHENERAQSTCSNGGLPFARFWMHNGFVSVGNRKMSKSLGNTMVVHELLKQHPGEVLRFVLLSAHYRQPLDWSATALEQAHRTLDRMYSILRDADKRFGPFNAAASDTLPVCDALDDDLNTPVALAELSRVSKALANADNSAAAQTLAAELLASGRLLGVLQSDPSAWLEGAAGNTADGDNEQAIQALIDARNEARRSRDFQQADSIRDQLTGMGITLEDGANGTRWRRERANP